MFHQDKNARGIAGTSFAKQSSAFPTVGTRPVCAGKQINGGASPQDRNKRMKKSVGWMEMSENNMLDQFDQFTLKLPGYGVKYGLSVPQTTAMRNDYLWLRHACTCTSQFEQELSTRVQWRNDLKNGPESSPAAQVPSIGSEFVAPIVPPVLNGVLPRWRALATYIKSHLNYEKADGLDLGIEPVVQPTQNMKPTAKLRVENGHVVRLNVFKDGHDSTIVWCRRGAEVVPTKLGVFRKAKILDDRPNLVAGQPEQRDYTLQYVDNDEPVGEVSDVLRVVTPGLLAA
jgi:hypothetical protein